MSQRTVIGIMIVLGSLLYWGALFAIQPIRFISFFVALTSVAYFLALFFVAVGLLQQSGRARTGHTHSVTDYTIDILLSIFGTIIGFAGLFTDLGLNVGGCLATTPWDALYFSMVTFSTLGYGDITPGEFARFPAAAEAIIGNLHLGLFVAAAFFLLQQAHKTIPDPKAGQECCPNAIETPDDTINEIAGNGAKDLSRPEVDLHNAKKEKDPSEDKARKNANDDDANKD